MKLIILAFIISISLHLLLLKEYQKEKLFEENSKKVTEPTKKSEIKYVKIKKENPTEELKTTPKQEVVEKNEIQKPLITKESIVKNVDSNVQRKKVIPKEIKEEKKVLPTEEVKKANELQNKVLNDQIVKKDDSLQKKTLENYLEQKEPVNQEVLNELQRLYGEEYQNLTKIQKAYLEKNFSNFQVITQRVLNRMGYPRLAAKMKLAGTNVVEFMFYPDGSIKDLKIINTSGYAVFDSYTLELIEIAYKDYPKPDTPTKLRFNVQYRLF